MAISSHSVLRFGMGRDELAFLQWKDVCTWSTFMDEETGLWRTQVLRLLRVTQLRSGRWWDFCSSPHQACDPQSSATVGQIGGEVGGSWRVQCREGLTHTSSLCS